MTTGIRRYGPGKFDTILDSYVHGLGSEVEVGDVSEIGIIYSRTELGPEALKDIEEDVTREEDEPLTQEERSLITESYGAILTENDQGFVSVDYFSKKEELDQDWTEVEADVESMYEEGEEEGNEEGDEEGEEEEEPAKEGSGEAGK